MLNRHGLPALLLLALLCCFLLLPGAQADMPFDPDTVAESVLRLFIYDSSGTATASGSGFVMFDSSTLVTNYHVIEDCSSVTADNDDGTVYQLTGVLVASEEKDIAILRFASATDRTPLAYSTDALKRGNSVWTIGYPLGYSPYTLTTGIISSIYSDENVDYVQYDAPITHGNSGGALVNDKGQVIGITCAKLTGGEDMNLAIRIQEVLDLYSRWDGTVYPIDQYQRAKPSAVTSSGGLAIDPTPVMKNGIATVSWSDSNGYSPYRLEWSLCYGDTVEGYTWYTEASTKVSGCSCDVKWLIPGQTYMLYLTDSRSNTTQCRVTVPSAEAYGGSFSLALTPSYQKENGTAKKTKGLDAETIRQMAGTYSYGVTYKLNVPQSLTGSSHTVQFAIAAPNGYAHMALAMTKTITDSVLTSDTILQDDFFSTLLEEPDGVVQGNYRVTVYIDGREAVSQTFYVSGSAKSSRAATPKPTAKSTATPKPTATPQSRTFSLDGTCSVENGKVTVRWTDSDSASPYKVSWQLYYNGNLEEYSWYNTDYSTDLYTKSCTLEQLVPGHTYRIIVKDKNGKEISKEYRIPEADTFQDGSLRASQFSLSLTRAYMLDGWTDSKELGTMKASTIKKRIDSYYYGTRYRLTFPRRSFSKTYFIQFETCAPNGYAAITNFFDWELESGWTYIYTDGLMNKYFFSHMNDACGDVLSGTYTVRVYFNGMKVASSTFRVD